VVLNSRSMPDVEFESRLDTDPVVRFGAYEVDLRQGELRKNGLRLRLQGQPFHVLSILLKRSGDVVTREDLRQAIWPMDTFVDFDHALNTAVKKIRAVLDDDADNPRFIETVPRRGYRFIAPLQRQNVLLPPPKPSTRSYRTLALAGLTAIALAVLGVIWKVVPRRPGDQTVQPVFQRLTFDRADFGQARFAPDGVTVVFSAGWSPPRIGIYTQRVGATVPQSLGLSNAALLAISRENELALLDVHGGAIVTVTHENLGGILARAPLGGGAPRELLPDVEDADWSPDGQLAVVRRVAGKSRLEFPVGKVLYENTGWIASPRFSPTGDLIAFLDHPSIPDDRGYVGIVDLQGRKRTLSGLWESERGLAWKPIGAEVWFAATRSGVERELYGVTLAGRERRVLSVAGGLTLQDISRDGRVLLTRDNERLGILFMGPGDKEPRDLSWLDWSLAADISPDGKEILFDEEGGNAGISYQAGLRTTDGSPPIMLGQGNAQSLSPDRKWALSVVPPPNDQLLVLPTGAGTPRTLDRGSIEHYQFAKAQWFPDGKQIVFAGFEPGHAARCYVQSVDVGKPRSITAEGVLFCSVSPNADILALTEGFQGLLYRQPLGRAPEKVLKFQFGEIPIGWTPDAKFLYLAQNGRPAVTISRLNVATGHRHVWKEIPLPTSASTLKCEAIVITPDGRSYAYTYTRSLSDLYVVQGLK